MVGRLFKWVKRRSLFHSTAGEIHKALTPIMYKIQ